jgi:hypothetical protein
VCNRAGRPLEPLRARNSAWRPGRLVAHGLLQQSAARSKKQIRADKMRAALRLGAEIKGERARKKAERAEAKKREAEKRNAARLRYLEELLRTRGARQSR